MGDDVSRIRERTWEAAMEMDGALQLMRGREWFSFGVFLDPLDPDAPGLRVMTLYECVPLTRPLFESLHEAEAHLLGLYPVRGWLDCSPGTSEVLTNIKAEFCLSVFRQATRAFQSIALDVSPNAIADQWQWRYFLFAAPDRPRGWPP